MRHIGTLIAALVVGPLAWFLLAIGQDRSAQVFANAQDGSALHTNDFVRPVLLLAAAGIVLGLIATLRFSPLGAVLTGIVYAATYLGLLINPTWVLKLVDHKLALAGHQADLATPVRTGTTLLLGSLLLVGVASFHRWRRWPRPDDDAPAAVVPDQFISPVSKQDRPLGAEGLGLAKPRASDPDLNTRYSAEPERPVAGGQDWAGSLRGGLGDFGDARRQSDKARQPFG